MTRQIKFRGRDKVCDNMYYFDIYELSSNHPEREIYLGSQEYIMQYTGLKDENGKEIYEGDIVEGWAATIDAKKIRMVVEFSMGGYDLIGGPEIIGNIYENPDLIPNN